MHAILGLLVALGFGIFPGQQPGDPNPTPVGCFVSPFRGAARPQGAVATMIVVSDGAPCPVNNWGNPDLRQNPATSAVITLQPQHGTLEAAAPRVLYKAETGYVGSDEFAVGISHRRS